MFRTILLAVELTGNCMPLINAAVELATRNSASVVVCHVSSSPEKSHGSALYLLKPGELEDIRKRIEQEYRPVLSRIKNCSFLALTGFPHVEILRLARRINPDLILMGPCMGQKSTSIHPESTLGMVSLNAKCPVMVVGPECTSENFLFNDIIAATDFSEHAGHALEYAIQLANIHASKLHLVHVAGECREHNQRESIRKNVFTRCRNIGDVFNDTVVEIEYGHPADSILEYARKAGADLIVMAHYHCLKIPWDSLSRSTTLDVSRRSCCPTISINRPYEIMRTV